MRRMPPWSGRPEMTSVIPGALIARMYRSTKSSSARKAGFSCEAGAAVCGCAREPVTSVMKKRLPASAAPARNVPSRNARRPTLLLLFLSNGELSHNLTVDRVLGEWLVHLVPTLLRPVHFLFRRRVPLVLRRVVVEADAQNLAAGGNLQRLLELVLNLPVEVELRDVEDRLLAAIPIDDDPFPAPSAPVAVARHTL